MRKYLSVFLVIVIVLTTMGFSTAMAEDTNIVHSISGTDITRISSREYTAHTGAGLPINSPMNKGETLTYSLDFEASGEYRISLVNKCFNDTAEMEITIKDWSVMRTPLPNSAGASQTVELGTAHFGKGSAEIVMKLHLGACYPSALLIERVGDRKDYYIAGNKPDAVSGDDVTKHNPSEGMGPGSYAEYVIDAEYDGIYDIYASVAASTDINVAVQAYIDGVSVGKAPFVGKDWTTFETVHIGSIELTRGEHTLKIKALEASMRFGRAKITSIHLSTINAFLDEVREADSAKLMREVLEKYNDEFYISYIECLDDVYYDRMITDKLAGISCLTLSEFDGKFLAVYNEELKNPLVTLTQNGEKVTSLIPGEFSVTIAPRFEEKIYAVAALYTDDQGMLDSYKEADISPYEETVITGLEAKEGSTLFKIFFLDDREKINPVNPVAIHPRLYVSPNGNDSAVGTEDNPLKTIGAAISKARSNSLLMGLDTIIYLFPGEHFVESAISIDDTFGLTEDMGLHFESLDSDNPAVISGGCDIKGWTDANQDGIYEATVPEEITDVRQLYINELPAVRARSKEYYIADSRWDNTDNNIYKTDTNGNEVETSGLTEDGFYVSNPSFPSLSKPQDAEIRYLILWTIQRLPVDDIVYDEEAEKTLIKMAQPAYSNALKMICDGGVQPTIGQKFMVENDLSLLDENGEFYFDKDSRKIYYKPFADENMANVRAVAAMTEQFFNISGSSHESKVKNVSFNNIKFRYGGCYTKVNSEGAVSFQAENLANAKAPLGHNPIETGKGRTLEANIMIENADGISFTNCDISCMGASALRLGHGVTNSAVKGNTFSDIGGSALSIGTWESGRAFNSDSTAAMPGALAENIDVEDNVILRTGIDFMFSPALSIYYAKNIDVIHNTIAHAAYSGISVNWGWTYDYKLEEIKDENNKDITIKTDIPSTSNKLGVGGHNISYNRIYDISKTVVDGGHIYNVGYMTGCNITHNYLTDSPDHGGVYLDTGASNIKINNNVFERCQKYNIAYGNSEFVVGNVATNNWADKEQSKEWPGEGCSFETVAGVTDANWSDEAKAVMTNAGVREAYKTNLSAHAVPEWRTVDHYFFSDAEGNIPGRIFIPASTYTDYYIKDSIKPYKPNGPEKAEFNRTVGIKSFYQKEWIEYEVEIPESGEYYLSIYYNRGSDGKIDIFMTSEKIPASCYDMDPDLVASNGYAPGCPAPLFSAYILTDTNTKSTAYIPHTFIDTATGEDKPISLNKGKYYLRIHERSGGTNFSGFALTPVK